MGGLSFSMRPGEVRVTESLPHRITMGTFILRNSNEWTSRKRHDWNSCPQLLEDRHQLLAMRMRVYHDPRGLVLQNLQRNAFRLSPLLSSTPKVSLWIAFTFWCWLSTMTELLLVFLGSKFCASVIFLRVPLHLRPILRKRKLFLLLILFLNGSYDQLTWLTECFKLLLHRIVA